MQSTLRITALTTLRLAIMATLALAGDRNIGSKHSSSTNALNTLSIPGAFTPTSQVPSASVTRGTHQASATAPAEDCSPSFKLQAERDHAWYGLIMNNIGDLNDDTYDDVWIAELAATVPGRGYIYSGYDQSLLHTVELTGASGVLRECQSADLNGDGYLDLIVTIPSFDGTGENAGRVSLMYGSSTPFPALIDISTPDATIDGPADSAIFGLSLVVLSDIDGDDRPDLAVGAPGWEKETPGSVHVFSGSDLTPIYSLQGTIDYSVFGFTMKSAGDVNNDGNEDLIIGAAYGVSEGYADVVSAVDGTLLYHLVGENVGDAFSWYGVCGPGDLNGDGYDDVIVGAYGNDAGGSNAGRVYGFFGGISGPSPDTIPAASADFIITGSAASDLGFGVGGIGDINADGVPDFAVGAIYYGVAIPGKLHIFSGADASRMSTLTGIEYYEDFGGACLAPWDLDGDNVKDLLVGAFCQSDGNQGGPERGRVYAYSLGDLDQDAVIAQCDNCLHITNPDQSIMVNLTGDIDDNGSHTAGDIIHCVNYIFKSQLLPHGCEAVADFNCDGQVTSSDIIAMVNCIFKSDCDLCDVCSTPDLGWECLITDP